MLRNSFKLFLLIIVFFGFSAQAEEQALVPMAPLDKLAEYREKALDPTRSETQLGYFYLANLWTLNSRIVHWTLSSMDKAGVLDELTYSGLAEFVDYQLRLPKGSEHSIQYRFVLDALVVLAKSGNDRYVETFDRAIDARKKIRKELKIKQQLIAHSTRKRLADTNEVVEYFVNGLSVDNTDAQNEEILKSAYSSGIRSEKFWSKVNELALSYVNRGDRSGGWWVKALGSSGNQEYKQTLLDILARPVQDKAMLQENAIHKSVFKHASFASARINAYEAWFKTIDEMKVNKHNLSSDERHFISVVTSPLWRVRHSGTEWIAQNRYQNQVGLRIISEALRDTFVDASVVGNHDIVTAAKLLRLLGAYCEEACVDPINGLATSYVEKEIRAHARKALKRIQKRIEK